MKKKVILSLLFLVCMLTLSACGGQESGEGDGITGYNYRNTTDDSLWMFHTDGSYIWYRGPQVTDDYYYAGTYRVLKGQEAVDFLVNDELKGTITEADLGIQRLENIDSYVVIDCQMESTIIDKAETLTGSHQVIYSGLMNEQADGSVTLNVANMNNGAYFQFVRATGE